MAEIPHVGMEFAGYRIESLIGRGGMSVVYRAEHLRLTRKVALKFLAVELSEDDTFRERFVRETRLAGSLDHPNIVPIYDAGERNGLLYIVMRYVRGDLASLLQQQGRLQPVRVLSVIEQTAAALDAAHNEGLVHRDVKPANILIAPSTSGDVPDLAYMADFGLTKDLRARGITSTSQFMGTADYIAPEQIEGGPIDGRTDIYALGCVTYECLTGRAPFGGESDAAVLVAHLRDEPPPITATRDELPAGVDAVVSKAMAKAPDDRYSTCAEFVTALRTELQPAGSPEPLGGRPTTGPQTARPAPQPVGETAASLGAFGGSEDHPSEASEQGSEGGKRVRGNQSVRTALIAAGGVIAGVAIVLAVIFAMNRGDHTMKMTDRGTAMGAMGSLSEHLMGLGLHCSHAQVGEIQSQTPEDLGTEVTDAVKCTSDDLTSLESLYYYQLHDKFAAKAHLQAQARAHNLAYGTGSCERFFGYEHWSASPAKGVSGAHTTTANHGRYAGRVLCYSVAQTSESWIEWFDSDTSIDAQAVVRTDNKTELYRWWLRHAGPSHPAG